MAIPKFLEDLLIISKLGDNPGADNGLSSSGLREKFDEAGVKIQKYINDTLIPALSGLSNPEEGLNMKNDIAMGGHRVTGLGEPVEHDDALPLGYANGKFAPAGYGLGGSGQPVTISNLAELDNIKANGRYAVASTTVLAVNGIVIQNFTLEVSMFTIAYGHQIIKPLGYTGTLTRKCEGYEWGEFEWDTPPLYPGVEYRTTERYNGKPVYALDMPAGTLAGKQPFSLDMEFANIDECVDCICHVGKGLVSLFEMSQWGIYTVTQYKFAPDAIYGVSNSNDNLANVKFALKYTKNTN